MYELSRRCKKIDTFFLSRGAAAFAPPHGRSGQLGVRVGGGDFLALPLLDGFRQETSFLVGIRCVVVFALERLQRIVTGLGLRVCVGMGHDDSF